MTTLNFSTPPQSVCLLRLSAIGDTCHGLAVLRALQTAWPQTRFSWVIGRVEARLMTAILPEIEFIIFDKRSMRSELLRLRRLLRGRRFDLLLDLQLSIRASLISCLITAPIKLGFDRARAHELQWCFTNARIEPAVRQHVLDSFFGFVRACGIRDAAPRWNITLPPESTDYAAQLLADAQPTLLISPCSSHALRNWRPQRYAAVANHAAERHKMRVILIGGRTELEARFGAAILEQAPGAVNQIGRDTLPQLLGLLAASTVLLTPDSGPAHMATMVALPVIGLYAATNPSRVGPYFSRASCIDKYDEAARRYLGKPAQALSWNQKVERPGVMDLIEVGEVIDALDAVMAWRKAR